MATQILNYATHAVAESSDLKATKSGNIRNIQATANIDNGTIVGKGAYLRPDVYAEAAATTFTGTIIAKTATGLFLVEVNTAANAYLVLTAPLIYEEYTTKCQDEANFYNLAGDVLRAYQLEAGDRFAISAAGITGVAAVGANVTVTAKKVAVV